MCFFFLFLGEVCCSSVVVGAQQQQQGGSACRGSERVLVVVVVQVAFLGLGVEGGASRQAGRQQALVVERTNALGSLRRYTYVCVVAVRFSPEINTVLVDTRGEFL